MDYTSRSAADAAARRALRKIYGASYVPKVGVDFTLSRCVHWAGWRFDFIGSINK